MALSGNEIVRNIVGFDGGGKPAATAQDVTVTALANFEGSYATQTPQSATSNTVLAAINVPFALVAGGQYIFNIYLTVTSNASGGLKLQFGGTATTSVLSADTWAYNGTTTVAQQNITSLASTLIALTGQVTSVNIQGSITCLAAGTFFLQFAQNASFATPTTINAGSNFWIDRLV